MLPALKRDADVECWGENGYGQASAPLGTFTQVSVGESHTCGLKPDGAITCWGANYYGQSATPSGSHRRRRRSHLRDPEGWGHPMLGELGAAFAGLRLRIAAAGRTDSAQLSRKRTGLEAVENHFNGLQNYRSACRSALGSCVV